MDLLSMTVGVVAGSAVFGGLWLYTRAFHNRLIAEQREEIFRLRAKFEWISLPLANLRANCFITNERGHRVRYIDATPARRAKAETLTREGTTNGY